MKTDLAVVSEAFALGAPVSPPREVARGEMGYVFRVETTTGTWALKGYRSGAGVDSPGDLALQDAFMDAAAQVGVCFPKPCRTRDDQLLADVEGERWKAFEWIDIVGTPSADEAGDLLGRLHSVGWPTDKSVDPWYTKRTFGGSWEDLAERSRGEAWHDTLLSLLPELIAQDEIAARAEMPPAHICHCDINEANVVLDSRGRIVVLDWDNCGPLSLEREVGYVLVNPLICPDSATFVAAYRKAGGAFAPQSLDVFGSAIAANNNYLAKMIIDTTEGNDWARTNLLAMLEHPLRITDLERVLDDLVREGSH